MNLPLASRHLVAAGVAIADGHFTNFPLASRQDFAEAAPLPIAATITNRTNVEKSRCIVTP